MKSEESKNNKKPKGAKERKQNWKEYTATVEDIQRFLEDHVMLRYNVVTRQVEGHLPPKLGGYRGMNEQNSFTCSDLQPPNLGGYGNSWEPVTDRLVNSLQMMATMTDDGCQTVSEDIPRTCTYVRVIIPIIICHPSSVIIYETLYNIH